ncbi:MAG: hypothetical protein KC684_10215, partial [Candidatus Omnitrophica bacterium]|nr:hypothetical protein [Candidatus Omnitrophota bacterium]
LENELQALKQIFQGKEGSEVTDLGAELERLKSEKDKWGEEELKGAAQIGALREEISRLQEEYQGEQSSLKEKLEKTEVSRQNLEEELKRAQGKLAGIEQKAKEIERTNSDKLRDAYTQISDLKAQLEGQKPRETEHIRQQLTGARAAVDELKKERERVLQLKNKAEEQVAKIKEHNTYLLEKDKALQYELTKSRAQRIGLEKMCEDFKMQMERASASPKV